MQPDVPHVHFNLGRAFDLANRRYQNGVSSYLEVLDAERNLFSSELALTQAQHPGERRRPLHQEQRHAHQKQLHERL